MSSIVEILSVWKVIIGVIAVIIIIVTNKFGWEIFGILLLLLVTLLPRKRKGLTKIR